MKRSPERTRDRSELRTAFNFLREGDTLLVWKFSWLARSIAQVIRTAAELERWGVTLKALSSNIYTSTPEERLFVSRGVAAPAP